MLLNAVLLASMLHDAALTIRAGYNAKPVKCWLLR